MTAKKTFRCHVVRMIPVAFRIGEGGAIAYQVELQRKAGGNAMIGRELYPLLRKAGFSSIRVSPRMVYADGSRPGLVEGFTKKTFTAMIEGVRESAIRSGRIEEPIFDRGIRGLYRTAEPDGVFCYTLFKAVGAANVISADSIADPCTA